MGYKERLIINDVLLKGTKKGRLFRANSGMAWAGMDIKKLKNNSEIRYFINILISAIKKIFKKLKGLKILLNPRPFHGMPEGTADVIGWESVNIASPCCGSCKWCEYGLDYLDCKNEKNDLKNILIDIDTLACVNYEPRQIKKIAIFKGVEIKTGNQKLTPEQENWRNQLIKDGGIYEERRG